MKTFFHGLLKKMDVKITAEVLTSVLKELEIKLLYTPEKTPGTFHFYRIIGPKQSYLGIQKL